MIIVNKTYQVTTTHFPATWTVVSTNACAVPAVATGTTTDGYITIEFRFQDEDCFDNARFTLTVEDYCGTVRTLSNFSIANICGSWTLGILHDNQLNFTASVIGGTSGYGYTWDYDTSVFSQTPASNPDNGVLSLQVNGIPQQETYIVTLTAVDYLGCIKQVNLPFNLAPAFPMRTFDMTFQCATYNEPVPNTTGTVNRVTYWQKLNFAPAPGRTIDYSTLYFQNVPPNVFPVHQNNGWIVFYANTAASFNSPIYVKAYVKDSLGITSKPAIIGLQLVTCLTAEYPPVPITSNYVFAPGEATVGAVAEIDLEHLVAGDEIDWSTFTFVQGTSQTLVSANKLTGIHGAAEACLERTIKYTVSSIPVNSTAEILRWTIRNKDGKLSKQGRIYIDFQVAAAPVATADSFCVVCGGSKALTPLSNDTGSVDPASFTVTASPSKGNYVYRDGNLVYTALPQVSGSDVLSYKVANPDGHFSNIANITASIVCAGNDNAATLCISGGTVNLNSFLSSWASTDGNTSGGWTASGTNPSSISLSNPGAVSFSGANPGEYEFIYTVTGGSCTDTATVRITLLEASGNDNCANAYSVNFPVSNANPVSLSSQQIFPCDSDSSFTLPVPSSWPTGSRKDVWYKFTTTGNFVASLTVTGAPYGIEGILQPMLVVYNSAGAPCSNNDFTVKSQSAAINGSRVTAVEVAGTAGTYWVRVAALNANVGKFNLTLAGQHTS